jgi:hypothetical protein
VPDDFAGVPDMGEEAVLERSQHNQRCSPAMSECRHGL